MNNPRFSEAFRRLALLIAIPLGALFINRSAPELIELRSVDWERKRSYEIASFLTEEARRDLNAYIQEETQGALIELPENRWSDFLQNANETLEERPHDKSGDATSRGGNRSLMGRVVYFPPQDPRIQDWISRPEMSRGYAYLRLQGETDPPRFQVSRVNPSLSQSAPIGMLYPNRYLGWLLILVGLITYALVPWPRRSDKQFSPMSPCNAFLADIVGYLLWGTFVGTWAGLIQSRNLPGHGEWTQIAVFTFVFWGLALSGVVILAIVVSFLSFRLTWNETGIGVSTISKYRQLQWHDIKQLTLKPIVYRFAERIRALGWLLLLFQTKAAGPVLAMQTRSEGLFLETAQGSFGIDLGNLSPQGLTEFAEECRSHNIPVPDEFCRASSDIRNASSTRVWPIYVTILPLIVMVFIRFYRSIPGNY
jgi:hypothetical protein